MHTTPQVPSKSARIYYPLDNSYSSVLPLNFQMAGSISQSGSLELSQWISEG
jgi:hypothetical protein